MEESLLKWCGSVTTTIIRSFLWTGKWGSGIEEEAKEAELALSGKHILLAEDNDLNWEIAESVLLDAEFELNRTENGQICVDKFRELSGG